MTDKDKRTHRRVDTKSLTNVKSKSKTKTSIPKAPTRKPMPKTQIDSAAIDAVDETLSPMDSKVLSLYLRTSSKITAKTIIPEKIKLQMNKTLRSYPFWHTISENEKQTLSDMYLDYYVSNLLVRSYNEALLLMMEDRNIDMVTRTKFKLRRNNILERKDFLDDILIGTINTHMGNHNDKMKQFDYKAIINGESSPNQTLREIIADLEKIEPEKTWVESHYQMIAIMNDKTELRDDK